MGARLVLVFCPPLNAALANLADSPPPEYSQVEEWARQEGLETIWLAGRLADVEAIRLDPCCHFNARGQALIAKELVQFLEEP